MNASDKCGLYFGSIVIDVTIGTFISFALLYSFDKIVSYQSSKRLKSGNYFKKVRKDGGRVYYEIDYVCWAQQTAIWLTIVFIVSIKLTPDEVYRNCRSGAVQE